MQDYNVAVTDARHRETVEFWRSQLIGINGGFRWRVNDATAGGKAEIHSLRLSKRATETLNRLANDDIGRFAITTTAIAYVLSRYFQQSQIIMKTPAPASTETPGATSSIPIIFNVQEDWTVGEYLRESCNVIELAYSTGSFPLTAFLERDYSLDANRMTNIAVRDSRVHSTPLFISEEDILIQLNPAGPGTMELRYSAARMEPFLVLGFAGHVVRALEQFDNVDHRLEEIDLLSNEDTAHLTADFNDTVEARDSECVVSLFEAQVQRTPEATAVTHKDSFISYAALNARANQLARHLTQAFDCHSSRAVGVMVDRSPEAVVAIVGALKSGAAYVPIDPEYPADRIANILEDSNVSILLTQSDYLSELQDFGGKIFAVDLQLAELTTATDDLDQKPLSNDIAYVLYTSGSTGKPKGCQTEHRSLSNYLSWATGSYFEDESTGNFALYSSLSFDFTITNIFCPLLRGRSLFIYDQSQDIHHILEHAFGPQSFIDTMKLTPSHISLLGEIVVNRTNVRKVIVGGEELRIEQTHTLQRINASIDIYNEYGPTEATVGCIVKRIEAGETDILIGKPVANMQVFILDARQRLAPIGARGEIYVGGHGVARGYCNRPDLTAAKFVPNPFANGSRLYKTGDVGRWLPDGNIQCFGRTDNQVKIRGNRVELGEIESVLLQHADVSQSIVVAQEDRPGEKQLVAYVAGGSSLSASTLRELVASKLPVFMIPAFFVFLETLPLTTNGKVNKNALPAPKSLEGRGEGACTPPRTVDEEELLRIWQEVLRNDRLGIDENFFEVGGDSLTAVQVISRVWQRLGIEITINDVFEASTVTAMAIRLRDARERRNEEVLPPLVPVSRSERIPLSFAQQRLWFLSHLEGGTATYNVAHALLLEGKGDASALKKSLEAIISRHEVLRTNLVEEDGWPLQTIREDCRFDLELIALREGDADSQIREAQLLADERAALPFDLSRDLLLRATLVQLRPDSHVLIVVMHHIIWDAWSAGVFNRELAELYRTFNAGALPALPPLPVQYADFAHWQRHTLVPYIKEKHLPYWIEKLSGVPPLLELRADRPRPAVQSYAGAKEDFQVDDQLTQAIHRLAQQYNATLFMTLLTAFAVVLYRHSAQTDMVIGSPAASRTRPEIESLIGFFVNMLALRVDLTDDPTFEELLFRVRRTSLEAYQYQDTPFDLIVETLQPERNLAHNPIFQVSFALQEEALEGEAPLHLRVTPIEVPAAPARFDIELAIETAGKTLSGTLVYNRDLFDPATIIEMRDQFIGVLRSMVANVNQRLSTLSLLDELQWHTFLSRMKAERAQKAILTSGAQRERTGYVGPRNATEEMLTRIWADVLRRTQIGIHDNFFELGGDSILSIQVISRAGKAGLRLTTQQIFRHQTIAELAAVVSGKTGEAEQGLILGTISLTPIQHWFFELTGGAQLHFNQSLLLETPPGLEKDALNEALRALIQHHDMLRLRVEPDRSEFVLSLSAEIEPFEIDYIDLSEFPNDLRGSVLQVECERLQARVHLQESPLMRVAYLDFGLDEPGRLLWIIHHLIVDGVSWRILIEDFVSLYEQRGGGASLPPKTTSFKEWTLRLNSWAKSSDIAEEARYWADPSRARIKPLPLDSTSTKTTNTVADAEAYAVRLNILETRNLLEGVARHHGAQANEALIAAVLVALTDWTGEDAILIDLEGHGREDLFEGVDLSRTVGWFTALFPVIFETHRNSSPIDALRLVKDQVRAIPNRGVGYGLLRYCSLRPETQSRLRALPQAQVVFNYLGQTDQVLESHDGFRLAAESSGTDQDPRRERPHFLEINAIVSGGELQVDWIYCRNLHRRETIARLAESFRKALGDLLASCSPAPQALLSAWPDLRSQAIADVYALSPLQSGMLFTSILDAQSSAYFEQLSCEIEGPLDVELFRLAWQSVVSRHDILRTAFFWESLEQPLQVVFRPTELAWEYSDWLGIARHEQAGRFEQFLKQDRNRKFDLRRVPAFRLTLIRFSEQCYGFCWSHHHILLDGWSVANILKEVISIYRAGGLHVQLPHVRQFRSYVDWLQSQDPVETESFWRDYLRGFASPTPVPADRNQSFAQSYDKEECILSQALSERLRSLAQHQHITLNTLMRGLWAILLSRYCDERDVCFGVTLAGRPAQLEGVEEIVGLFINTLPLRPQVERSSPVSAWLPQLQALHADLDGFAHSDLAEVQRWAGMAGGARLFNSIFVFENYPVHHSLDQDIEGLKFGRVRAFEQTEYPLTLAVVPDRELYIRLRYDIERFDSVTIHRIVSHLRNVLELVAQNPDIPVGDVEILSESERRQLDGWNDSASVEVNLDVTIRDLLERQVARTPSATAVVCGNHSVTFQELNERANRLANLLVDHGAGPNLPVAILVERSIEMIIAVFGALKSGGAYLPLDVAYPKERIRLILNDSQARVILTQESLISELPSSDVPVVCLDRDRDDIARQSSNPPTGLSSSADLAYIIYTSGTTGRPKGVAVIQRSVVNLLNGLDHAVYGSDLGKPMRVGINGPLAFDTSVKQIIQLLNGHCLVIIPEETRSNPVAFIDYLRQISIDVLDGTPSHLEVLIEGGLLGDCQNPVIQKILVGGEPVSAELWNRLADCATIEAYNVYGPTETTVDATIARIGDCDHTVIGGPINNVRLYVLHSGFRRVPVGATGELFIGGAGLARGYSNDAAAQAMSFLPDPFSKEPGARLYKTGDLVRWRVEGNLEFVGRRDEQLKIRGFRIEPREIENLLEQHQAILRSVVIAHGAGSESVQLVAYIVVRSDVAFDGDDFRGFLRDHVPDYMIPDAFVEIERLPLTQNGKLDRDALPAPVARPLATLGNYVPPRDNVERRLVRIFQQTLGRKEIGIKDSFFDLGGHSILAMKLAGRIQAEFCKPLPLVQLFETPTIEGLASTLRDGQRAIEWPSLVSMHPGGQGAPIFLLPGAGGNILYYYELAKAVGRHRPVYGLQAVGLDGASAPLRSIEAIARHNIDQISGLKSEGPYLLAGHSFGGKVAFEMSQQLRDAGLEVGLVAILDTPAPIFERAADRRDWDDARWLEQIVCEIEEFLRIDLEVRYDRLSTLSESDRLDYVVSQIERSGWWTPGAGRSQLRAHLQVYRTNYEIDYAVRDKFHPVPIVLFKASDEGEPMDHPSLKALRQTSAWGWERFSSKPVTVIEVPGDHLTMMSSINAANIAEHLSAYLDGHERAKAAS